jgi:hypothetical protein
MENKKLEKTFTESAALLSKFYLDLKNEVKTKEDDARKDIFGEISDYIYKEKKIKGNVTIKDVKAFLQLKIKENYKELQIRKTDEFN